jgi:hypothetical protein
VIRVGWAPSPFQHEIAGANLGIGLGAIAASVVGVSAAWTMFVVAASFLWSAAAVHIADMVRSKNFAINNAGPIFWWDILTPPHASHCAAAACGLTGSRRVWHAAMSAIGT